MKKYCICGGVTEYVSASPKFCSECGKNFELAAIVTQPLTLAKKVSIAKQNPYLYQQASEEVIPQLDKLDIIIIKNNNKKQTTIKDILGTEPIDTGRIQKKTRGRPKRINNEDIIANFKVEATPRGKNDPIEIEG